MAKIKKGTFRPKSVHHAVLHSLGGRNGGVTGLRLILLQLLSLVERLNLLLITRAQRRADKGWMCLLFPTHNPVPDDMP